MTSSSSDARRHRASIPLAVLIDSTDVPTVLAVPTTAEIARDRTVIDRVRAIEITAPVVIELEDPSEYLVAGDLLLITGLGLPDGREEVDAYVRRLVTAEIGALVFGLEPVHADIPAELSRACAAHGLPLIELPPDVVFAQVVSLVTRELEGERTRALARMNALTRKLTEAALHPRPAQRILEVLAHESGGWACLRVDDEALEAGHGPSGDQATMLIDALLDRLSAQSFARGATPTAFATVSVDGNDFEVTAHEVPMRSEPRGRASGSRALLTLACAPRLSPTDRTGLLLAANLLRLVVALPVEQSSALDQLMMHLLVDAAPPLEQRRDQARYARLLASSLAARGTRTGHAVVAVRPHGSHGGRVVRADGDWLRRLLRTPLVEQRGDRMRALATQPPGPVALDQATELGWRLAVSPPHPIDELPEAMSEAESLARIARATGTHQLGDLDQLWLAEEDRAARGHAERLLAPVRTPESAEIGHALATWLRAHGSWDRASRELGLHRNTVRRLIGAAARLLGRDLDDPVERARLLLAFESLDAG